MRNRKATLRALPPTKFFAPVEGRPVPTDLEREQKRLLGIVARQRRKEANRVAAAVARENPLPFGRYPIVDNASSTSRRTVQKANRWDKETAREWQAGKA